METITLKENALLLEKHIEKVKGQFTLNDAAAITGVAVEQARESLNELMSKYICHLQVSENGDLIYDFGSSPTRRGEKSFAEILDGIKNWLWKAFKIFFKAWITVTLVVYFVIFVLLLIAIIIGLTAANKDDDRKSSGGGAMFRLIGDVFYAIFRWNTITGGTYYQKDQYGQPYKHYKPIESQIFKTNSTDPKAKKNFISAVYDFVFGPPRVEIEPFENQKEVAAYARQNKGVMILPEFKALAGWNNDEAQEFMTDCIGRFNGSAEISPNAVLYADFYDLTRSKTQAQDGKIEWYWNEYEPEYELTGNTTGKNAGVIAMNAFNLIFASLCLVDGIDTIYNGKVGLFTEMIEPYVVLYGLGVVPFLFSTIFFLVPVLRYFSLIPKRNKRRLNNIKKRLVKVIYQQGVSKDLSLDEIVSQVNQGDVEKLSKPEVQSMMSKLIIDWGGEAIPQDDGTVRYQFIQLREELQEIRNIRATRDGKSDLGNIYMDTGKL
ncbi:hypothetical protein AD998_11270 [bacterium 336/3]|nr:hypothetical protein AD998_11270 [bacterium 336/3]